MARPSGEEVLRQLRASDDGATQNGLYHVGGFAPELVQEQLILNVRAYGVMIAPKIAPQEFPPDSPIAQGQFQDGTGFSNNAALMPGDVRIHTHNDGNSAGTYDSGFMTQTITRAARGSASTYVREGRQDNAAAKPGVGNYDSDMVMFGKRRYEMLKMRSSKSHTTEFITKGLQRGTLAQDLDSKLMPLIAHDVEDASINGDTDLALVAGDQRGLLLGANDGWLKISKTYGMVNDVGGAVMSSEHFYKAIKMRPHGDAGIQGLRWWGNPNAWMEWVHFLELTGVDVQKVSALQGGAAAPYGLPFVRVPLMPIDEAVPVGDAGAARVIGRIPGPFSFPPDDEVFSIAIDDRDALEITLPNWSDANVEERMLHPFRVCKIINDALVASGDYGAAFANVARVGQHGRIEFVGVAVGAPTGVADEGGQVTLAEVGGNCLALMGFDEDDFDGADVGLRYTGTSIWLAQPTNFGVHFSTADQGSDALGFRHYMKYEQGEDEYLSDIYFHHDATIGDPRKMVTITGLRLFGADETAVFA